MILMLLLLIGSFLLIGGLISFSEKIIQPTSRNPADRHSAANEACEYGSE